MAPAFSSLKQAAAFALLLLTILLLPALLGKSCLPSREQVYSTQGWAWGPWPWDRQQIFEEKGDIDIAFVGSSTLWYAIDTPYVQEQLSKSLGRPAVVRSICWGGSGFDPLYFITKDLLEHRKVRMLVFYDEINLTTRNRQISTWFRFADGAPALAGLPLGEKAIFYCASVLGMPRNLLGLLRANPRLDPLSPEPEIYRAMNQTPNPASRLGSLSSRLGFGSTPGAPKPLADYDRFLAKATPSDAVIFAEATREKFTFSRQKAVPEQLHFGQKFAELARAHGSRLVYLHIPHMAGLREPVIREQEYWPTALNADMAMLGIAPAALFGGLSDEAVRALFYNPAHMNKNGQEHFTPLITPSLCRLYESQDKP